MNKMKWRFLVLLLIACNFSIAQSNFPSVVVQSGFSNEISTHFMFSPQNNYLYGYNDIGEFILWEVRSGKQVKKIAPLMTEMPTLFYSPKSVFSKDERFILIPDYPKGNYFLYDVFSDKMINTFQPPFPNEKFIRAEFSDDGSRILFLAYANLTDPACRIQIMDRKGTLLINVVIRLPKAVESDQLLIQLLMKRMTRHLALYPVITAITVSPDLKKIWFATLKGNLNYLDIMSAPKDRELTELDYTTINIAPHLVIFTELSRIGTRIMAKKESSYVKHNDSNLIKRDSIFVIDNQTNAVEKVIASSFMLSPADKRSNAITTSPVTTGQKLHTYFQLKSITPGHLTLECRDLLSDRELFSYSTGDPFYYNTKGFYKPAQLNGGYVVAISDDQSLVAECTRDLIIHNVNKKTIKNYFPLSRGNLKLNCPVYLDSARLFIPKVYNDGFVLNLQSGQTERLNRELNCQDTVRNGANVFYQVDASAQLGLQNSCLSADRSRIGIINYVPDDLCNTAHNKIIQVYQADSLKKTGQYSFTDPEYSYYFNMLPGGNKFLVNYKLVDFSNTEKSQITNLMIVQRKDTFLAINPVFLPKYNSIFSILGTRVNPGNPDLIFAQFDLSGKLIRSMRFERKKSRLQFQTVIYEAQLSPDSSQLLFGLHDGTAGIFDLRSWKVTNTFEHGNFLEVKMLKVVSHTIITAGCFISNDKFVTNGSDGKINLWSTTENKLIRCINKEPLLTYGLTVSPDRKYLVGTDMDKSIVFINIETGAIDMRFIAFDHESYALIGKDGYYMANKRSNNNLTFFFNGKSYEFSQFDLYLNRPDRVMEGIGYISPGDIAYYRKAYEKRLERAEFKNVPTQISLDQIPEITVSGLPDGMKETTSASLSFTVSAWESKQKTLRLMVTVNSVPLYGVNGLELKQSSTSYLGTPVLVPLSYGVNRIEVSVINSQGVESLREYFTLNRIGVPPKPDLYIIAIGSGAFLQKNKNLTYPGKDAQDVIDLFTTQAGNYDKVFSYKLLNADVNNVKIAGLKEKLKKTRPDDYVVLFYAGHGILDKNLDFYLSTYNTDFSNPAGHALPYQSLEAILDSIPARNKVMFLDACHSGEVDKESVREYIQTRTASNAKVFRSGDEKSPIKLGGGSDQYNQLMQSLFTDLRRTSGTSVVAAAASTEYAEESDEWKNGAFTYCLKKGLKEKRADLDKDGIIYISELLEYVQKNVQELTRNGQRPLSRSENITTNTVIWR